MVRNAERIACVRTLRALALRCGVERVRDCAGKEAVEAMMARIRASDGDGLVEARAEAEAEFKRFLATYQEQAVEQGPAEVEHRSDPATEKKRLRGTSFLFTYNWRYMNKALPDPATFPRPQPCGEVLGLAAKEAPGHGPCRSGWQAAASWQDGSEAARPPLDSHTGRQASCCAMRQRPSQGVPRGDPQTRTSLFGVTW